MAQTQGTSGFGTLFKIGSDTGYATLTHGASNAAVTVTSRLPGTGGNAYTLTLTVSGTVAATTCAVSGTDIVVAVRSSSGTPLATAKEVVKAIRGNYTANGLVSSSYGGTGLSTVAALTETALSTGAAETFATIAEVKSISGPGLSSETIDATHMESPNSYREMLVGLKTGGEVSVEMNFLPGNANHILLSTTFGNRTKKRYQLVFPDTGVTKWQFEGYITSMQPSATIDDILSCSVSFTLTGSINFDA